MERFDNTLQQHHLHIGASVYGTEGDKLGTVKTWTPNHLVVEKGMIFSTDYYVPFSVVSNYTEDEVFLTVTKDEALNSGWENEPVDIQGYTESDDVEGNYASGPFRQNAFEIEPKLPPKQTS